MGSVILVLHPEQVRDALDLAAELGLDPELVALDLYGVHLYPQTAKSPPTRMISDPTRTNPRTLQTV